MPPQQANGMARILQDRFRHASSAHDVALVRSLSGWKPDGRLHELPASDDAWWSILWQIGMDVKLLGIVGAVFLAGCGSKAAATA